MELRMMTRMRAKYACTVLLYAKKYESQNEEIILTREGRGFV